MSAALAIAVTLLTTMLARAAGWDGGSQRDVMEVTRPRRRSAIQLIYALGEIILLPTADRLSSAKIVSLRSYLSGATISVQIPTCAHPHAAHSTYAISLFGTDRSSAGLLLGARDGARGSVTNCPDLALS
jgi:hypothetical protein